MDNVTTRQRNEFLTYRVPHSELDGISFVSLGEPASKCLGEGRVSGHPVLPPSVFIELFLELARERGLEHFEYTQLRISAPMPPPGQGARPFRVRLAVPADVPWPLELQIDEGTPEYPQGQSPRAVGLLQPQASLSASGEALASIRARIRAAIEPTRVRELAAHGLQCPVLDGIPEQLWSADGEALARVDLRQALPEPSGRYVLNPALLEAAFRVAGVLLTDLTGLPLVWPVAVERLSLQRTLDEACAWVYVRVLSEEADAAEVALTLFSDDGEPIAQLDGLCLTLHAHARRDMPHAPAPNTTIHASALAAQPPQTAESVALLQQLSGLSAAEGEQLVLNLVLANAVSVLSAGVGFVDPDQPLVQLGLDSVMALELRNRVAATTGLQLSA
ncbi:MAG TPA: polyketide synthase dehydratase domain-containing protein, partial [Polyangiaceae bacterium]